MKLKILLLLLPLLLPANRASAQRRLSLAEAIVLARAHRSETAQAGSDLDRAELGVLKARLERIHLTIQGTATEQVQDLGVQLTGMPVEICATGLAGTTCDPTAHSYRGTADLTIPIWS